MFRMKFLIGVVCLILAAFSAQAQEYGEFVNSGYNPNSVRPVHESNIMFKKTLWLRMSLKEKINQPFFATQREITKLIIEAAKVGIIRPYMNDSLRTRMPQEQFLENLKIPSESAGLSEEELALGFGEEEGGDDWGSDGDWGEGGGVVEDGADEFFAKDIHLLEIKEDLLFDKKRSRMLHDIQSITLVIPAEKYPTGLEKKLATFSYKELVDNLFRDNPDAIWYNAKNNRYHLNLEHAFDLRLFDAHIIKYDNPADEMIVDIYGDGKASVINSMMYQYYLVEYESNLWEN